MTHEHGGVTSDVEPGASEGSGLAIASLVLGILGLLTGVLVLGGVLGLVGLGLGVIHLRKRTVRRGMAKTGIGFSIVAVVLGAVALTIVLSFAGQMQGQGMGRKPPAVAAAKGKPAPDFAVTTLSGDVVRISELKGKRVVVNFWASWLPAGVRQVTDFVQLRREVPEDQLFIVGISGEEVRVLEKFLSEREVNYPMAQSARGVLPEPYSQIDTLPTTFFLDAEGVIDHVSVGYRGYDQLKARALGEQPGGDAPGNRPKKR